MPFVGLQTWGKAVLKRKVLRKEASRALLEPVLRRRHTTQWRAKFDTRKCWNKARCISLLRIWVQRDVDDVCGDRYLYN